MSSDIAEKNDKWGRPNAEDAPPITSVSNRARTRRMALPGIIALAAVLRLYGLADQSIWYDEGFTLLYAQTVDCSFAFFSKDVTSDAPLPAVLLAGWEKIADALPWLRHGAKSFDFWLRLLPFFWSVVGVGLVYAVCRLLFAGDDVALLAALLCAISPFQVYYAQELKPYSLLFFLSMAGLYCTLRALQEGRMRHWVGVTVLLPLAFYSHFTGVWTIALCNVYVFVAYWRERPVLARWFLCQSVAFALCLPIIYMAFQVSRIYENITTVYTSRPTFLHGLLSFKTFFAGYGAHALIYRPLFALAAALFLWEVARSARNPRHLFVPVLFVIIPILANIIIWRTRHFPIYEHRLFIFSSGIAYGAVGLGVMSLPRRIAWAAGIALVALMAAMLPDYYRQHLHPLESHRMGVRYKVDNRAAAAFLSAHLEPGDVVAHASHFTLFPFRHYQRDRAVRDFFMCVDAGEVTGAINAYPNLALWKHYDFLPTMAEEGIGGARRVWYVESWWEPFDISPHVFDKRRWLDARYARKGEWPFFGIVIYLYEADGEDVAGGGVAT